MISESVHRWRHPHERMKAFALTGDESRLPEPGGRRKAPWPVTAHLAGLTGQQWKEQGSSVRSERDVG